MKKLQKNLVLIGGSHLDEKIWDDLISCLNRDQFAITSLPRIGRDPENPLHLEEIARKIIEILPEESIIVAHSFGGVLAHELVGRCPEKIAKIIYLAALLPLDGENPFEFMQNLSGGKIFKAVSFMADRIVPKELQDFLPVMDAEVNLSLKKDMNIYPEPLLIANDRLHFKKSDYEKIEKYYIHTQRDEILPFHDQERLVSRVSLTGRVIIDAGHLPQLTKPEELAKWIEILS